MDTDLLFMESHRRRQAIEMWLEKLR